MFGVVAEDFEDFAEAVAEGGVFDERGVEAGYAEVGFGQGHFHVADDVDEEREGAEDPLEVGEVCLGCGADEAV